jgi:hypothetical protein
MEKKIEICHENVKWKNSKIFIFEIWNDFLKKFSLFENWTENFRLKFEKNGYITRGKWQIFEIKKSYISFMPPRLNFQ